MNTTKRALTAYEDLNMDGGAHRVNYPVAKRALEQGRDLIVHRSRYDGQRYHYTTFRVTSLKVDEEGKITGRIVTDDCWNNTWTATEELCEFAKTGKI